MNIQEALDLTGLRTLWAKIKQYITAKLEHKPDIYTSTSEPTSSDGNNGDLWLVYDAPPVVTTFQIIESTDPTVEPATYQYDEGMTWGQWVNSDYNDGHSDIVYIEGLEDNISDLTNEHYVVDSEDVNVTGADVIDPTVTYKWREIE